MDYTTTLTPDNTQPVAITIGNFDGMHRGHQHLMHELRMTAESLGSIPIMMTFEPHTLLIVRPDIDVRLLTTTPEKLALAKRYAHIDEHMLIHFTREVAAMTATEFMDTLRARFPLKALVVGENFSLGNKRMGDVAFLTAYGQEHGIVVRSIPLTTDNHERISSTRIRTLVSDGDVVAANELLGHAVLLGGIVMHGDERGRLIGFPTANLQPEPHRLIPANGVYAVRVRIYEQEPALKRIVHEPGNSDTGDTGRRVQQSDLAEVSTVYNGVANIGVRPTFNGTERKVEVHLLDVTLDLYDKYLSVEVIARLRGEQRFAGIDALKAQIAADAQQARQLLQHPGV
jgi:riboflavin kinase/FMN adenylyltransferase